MFQIFLLANHQTMYFHAEMHPKQWHCFSSYLLFYCYIVRLFFLTICSFMAVHIVLFLKLFNKKHRKVDFFHKKNCILVALSAKLLMPQKYLKIKKLFEYKWMYMCTYKKKVYTKEERKGWSGLLTGQSPQVQYFFPFFHD